MDVQGTRRAIRHVCPVRIAPRRLDQRKYIFKDGTVRRNDNPYALLDRPVRDSSQGGVVLLVAPPPVEMKPKKGKP